MRIFSFENLFIEAPISKEYLQEGSTFLVLIYAYRKQYGLVPQDMSFKPTVVEYTHGKFYIVGSQEIVSEEEIFEYIPIKSRYP